MSIEIRERFHGEMVFGWRLQRWVGFNKDIGKGGHAIRKAQWLRGALGRLELRFLV